MANWKPSAKTAVSVPATTDIHAIEQGGVIYKETNAQILALTHTGKIATTDTTDSTTKDTGSIITDGGIGVEKSINVGGSVQVEGVPVAGFLDDGTPYYKKRVQIGDWDMDTTAYVDIAHGLADRSKIMNISAWIRRDDDVVYLNLCTINSAGTLFGSIGDIGTTAIRLYRINAGVFDSGDYNSTSYNRGYISIDYIL